MNVDASDVALLITALGLGAVLQSVVAAVSQRRKLGADTMSVLTAAARELVEPLRRELREEREQHERDLVHTREQHSRELDMERRKVEDVRRELQAALGEASQLRQALREAREEADQLRREREQDHAHIRSLEARLS